MPARSVVTLPSEANYTGHRAELQRRTQTKRWLAERERHLDEHDAPSLVPETGHDWSSGRRKRVEH